MRTPTGRRVKTAMLVAGASLALVGGVLPALAAGDVLVTNGSPATPFPQNKQNEPAIAVDASNPSVLVAGANEEIDLAPCHGTRCPFTPGVGLSGVYFSFDGGQSWTQPTYTGWSARSGTPGPGLIGTLPRYFESGLVADGDPAVAFGPRPGAGGFSWANGSRLYYANLTSNFNTATRDETFKGFEGMAVSRTDDVDGAAAGNNASWMAPVIASRQSATTFSDKEQVWADNASSSPFFGNVYVCNAAFRSQEKSAHAVPAPLVFVRSTDGGNTWTELQISAAANNGQINPPDGCTIRTDSQGVVYVFGIASAGNQSFETLARSFDGGATFEPFRPLFAVVKPGVFDAALGRPVMDGVAGARVDLAAAPSVDIANGAPTGADATNELVLNWADARNGLNHEVSFVSTSTNQGQTWSAPSQVSPASDRPFYTAIAISPNGTDVYVTYDAYLAPYQTDTSQARPIQGVVTHADVGAGGAPGAFGELNRGLTGDARGSSQNGLTAEFFGDYVYAVATRTYGAAVWNDARNAADCPAIDAYREAVEGGPAAPRPAPLTQCPASFGNSDIYGGAYPDPTP